MQLKYRQLVFFIGLLLVGCTDSRTVDPLQRALLNGLPGRQYPAGVTPLMSVRFDQKQTITSQMLVKGSSLILSGKPFGFSLWDIGTNPLSPRMLYAYSDNIGAFSSMGGWTPDYYAGGAMGILGPYVLTSGAAGASLIDTTDKGAARELFRYPPVNGSEISTPMDPYFVYRAIVPDPQEPFFYGFREQDFVASLRLSGSGVNIETMSQYSDGGKGTCCALSATTFQGQAFVAFRSALRQFAFLGGGRIAQVSEITSLNATIVASSSDYLFIQHQAVPGNTYPSGIYVINSAGNSVAFLPMLAINFTVSPDGQYFYANLDNDSITIFRLNWGVLLGGASF